jgi:hypothetical protein
MPAATAEQGVDHRAAFPGFGMAEEKIVLFVMNSCS